MRTFLNRLIEAKVADPEDARRRRLLNILLLGVIVVCVLALVLTTLANLNNTAGNPLEVQLLYFSIIGALVGTIVIFFVNRYWKGWVASALFLLLITAGTAFADTPQEVVAGRSLFLFVLPII